MNILDENKEQCDILLGFFENLKRKLRAKVQIMSLRPKPVSTIESNFDGSFDFVIKRVDMGVVLSLIYDSCKKSSVNFILYQTFKNKQVFKFFISNPDVLCLTVDLWTAVEFTKKGVARSFATDSIFQLIENQHMSSTELLTLIYITHLHHKKENLFSDKNIYRFGVFIENLRDAENMPNKDEITTLLSAIRHRKLSLEAANEKALQILSAKGLKTSRSRWKDGRHLLFKGRNKALSLKKIIPVVGPDGVGKGSISIAALSDLKNWISFRYKSLYRIRKFYKLRKELIWDKHDKPDIMLDEQINHYILFTSFLTIRLLPILKRKKRILLDRYFVDYLATPIRYLDEGIKPQKIKFYNLMMLFTPAPYFMVYMGCKTSSLVERKDELPAVSIDFLQQLYCEFILRKRIPVVLFLSTENEIEISSEALGNFLESVS